MKKGALNLLVTILAVLYPIIVHLSVYFDITSIALIYFALLLIALTFDLGFKQSVSLSCLIILLITALLFVSLQFSSIFILYLPPIVISLGLFYGFASSLLPGSTPLITRIAAQVYKTNFTSEMERYTKACTVLWAVIMGIMVLETLLLALFASVEVWSLFCNLLNYGFIGLCFIIEYIYRIYRFGQKVSLMTYIKTLISMNWRNLIKGAA